MEHPTAFEICAALEISPTRATVRHALYKWGDVSIVEDVPDTLVTVEDYPRLIELGAIHCLPATDAKWMLRAAEKDPTQAMRTLVDKGSRLLRDEEFLNRFMRLNPEATLVYATKFRQTIYTVRWTELLRLNPRALEFAPPEVVSDLEYCRIAVEACPECANFVKWNNRTIKLVLQNPRLIPLVNLAHDYENGRELLKMLPTSPSLWDWNEVLKMDGRILLLVPYYARSPERCKIALQQTPAAFLFVPQDDMMCGIIDSVDTILPYLMQHPDYYTHLPEEHAFRYNIPLVEAFLKQGGETRWVPRALYYEPKIIAASPMSFNYFLLRQSEINMRDPRATPEVVLLSLSLASFPDGRELLARGWFAVDKLFDIELSLALLRHAPELVKFIPDKIDADLGVAAFEVISEVSNFTLLEHYPQKHREFFFEEAKVKNPSHVISTFMFERELRDPSLAGALERVLADGNEEDVRIMIPDDLKCCTLRRVGLLLRNKNVEPRTKFGFFLRNKETIVPLMRADPVEGRAILDLAITLSVQDDYEAKYNFPLLPWELDYSLLALRAAMREEPLRILFILTQPIESEEEVFHRVAAWFAEFWALPANKKMIIESAMASPPCDDFFMRNTFSADLYDRCRDSSPCASVRSLIGAHLTPETMSRIVMKRLLDGAVVDSPISGHYWTLPHQKGALELLKRLNIKEWATVHFKQALYEMLRTYRSCKEFVLCTTRFTSKQVPRFKKRAKKIPPTPLRDIWMRIPRGDWFNLISKIKQYVGMEELGRLVFPWFFFLYDQLKEEEPTRLRALRYS